MIVLDTHALLWWRAGGAKLSARARREIAAASRILVSPVSLWETAALVRKKRIRLDRDPYQWARDLFSAEAEDPVEFAPIGPAVAVAAGLLPAAFPGDPADRLLYATAAEAAAPLVTKDRSIRSYAATARDVRVIW